MSETKTFQTPLAIIADIHGNRWALEAVLRDIDRRGIQHIVNLGDHLTGPLDVFVNDIGALPPIRYCCPTCY